MTSHDLYCRLTTEISNILDVLQTQQCFHVLEDKPWLLMHFLFFPLTQSTKEATMLVAAINGHSKSSTGIMGNVGLGSGKFSWPEIVELPKDAFSTGAERVCCRYALRSREVRTYMWKALLHSHPEQQRDDLVALVAAMLKELTLYFKFAALHTSPQLDVRSPNFHHYTVISYFMPRYPGLEFSGFQRFLRMFFQRFPQLQWTVYSMCQSAVAIYSTISLLEASVERQVQFGVNLETPQDAMNFFLKSLCDCQIPEGAQGIYLFPETSVGMCPFMALAYSKLFCTNIASLDLRSDTRIPLTLEPGTASVNVLAKESKYINAKPLFYLKLLVLEALHEFCPSDRANVALVHPGTKDVFSVAFLERFIRQISDADPFFDFLYALPEERTISRLVQCILSRFIYTKACILFALRTVTPNVFSEELLMTAMKKLVMEDLHPVFRSLQWISDYAIGNVLCLAVALDLDVRAKPESIKLLRSKLPSLYKAFVNFYRYSNMLLVPLKNAHVVQQPAITPLTFPDFKKLALHQAANDLYKFLI